MLAILKQVKNLEVLNAVREMRDDPLDDIGYDEMVSEFERAMASSMEDGEIPPVDIKPEDIEDAVFCEEEPQEETKPVEIKQEESILEEYSEEKTEDILSDAEKESCREIKIDQLFLQGQKVRFKSPELARTADGVNQIKNCNYRFIDYNEDNRKTCFITRGNKQRKFEVFISSLEEVPH